MEIYFQKAKYPLNIVRMWVKECFCGRAYPLNPPERRLKQPIHILPQRRKERGERVFECFWAETANTNLTAKSAENAERRY